MDPIEVLQIGQKVTIDGEIPATITAINIRPATGGYRITYEVMWWDERSRKTEWVDPFEIDTTEPKKHSVNFV